MRIFEQYRKDPAWTVFLYAVFTIAFSMPLGRMFFAMCLIFTIADIIKKRRVFRLSLPGVGWLSYLVVAIVMTSIFAITNTDPLLVPGKGLAKITKLLWYIALPLTVIHINSKERFIQSMKWFLVGALITAVIVVALNPIGAWVQIVVPLQKFVDNGSATPIQLKALSITNSLGLTDMIYEWKAKGGWCAATYHDAIVKLGTMQDSQRLMAAFPVSVFLMIASFKSASDGKRQKTTGVIFAVLILLGLILTFKRGPLIAAIITLVPLCAMNIGWKKVLISCVAIVAIVVSIPSARYRMMEIPGEFSRDKGGRMTMWTEIVPKIHNDYPWGIGFRALTSKKMQYYSPYVEQMRNHVHSTPLQVFVDFSVIGIIVYTFWMGTGFYCGFKLLRRIRTKQPMYSIEMLAPVAAFSSLFLYGLIEYNLADSDIVLLYSFTMGLCAMGGGCGEWEENTTKAKTAHKVEAPTDC